MANEKKEIRRLSPEDLKTILAETGPGAGKESKRGYIKELIETEFKDGDIITTTVIKKILEKANFPAKHNAEFRSIMKKMEEMGLVKPGVKNESNRVTWVVQKPAKPPAKAPAS